MSEPAKSTIEIIDFPGIADVDPRDLQPGEAEIQVNCCSLIQGALDVRQGYRIVKFENS